VSEDVLAFVGELAERDPAYRYLLERGRWWPVRDQARPSGTRKLADGSCYANAYRRAAERGWRYVEGVAAAFEGIVVPHAWCADEDGFVVETTWQAAGCAYFGIELPLEAVASVRLETGRSAAVLPLLAREV
jgi:hypothetical protein